MLTELCVERSNLPIIGGSYDRAKRFGWKSERDVSARPGFMRSLSLTKGAVYFQFISYFSAFIFMVISRNFNLFKFKLSKKR